MTNPKEALAKAVAHCGGKQAELARTIKALPQEVWNWLNRPGSTVPAEYCPAIEALGCGVKRWDLRPADWYRIWPELIGADGAPAVPAEEVRDAA